MVIYAFLVSYHQGAVLQRLRRQGVARLHAGATNGLTFAQFPLTYGHMKKLITLLCMSGSVSFAQLGWDPYTGQPTQTLYGSAAGAGLGYMLAPAISKGPDAQWIGALTGMAAGGLLGNYMAGNNITHQQLNQQQNTQAYRPAADKQNLPAAIPLTKNTYQSPYSEFVVSTAEYKPGAIVNDPLEGKLFRIPR